MSSRSSTTRSAAARAGRRPAATIPEQRAAAAAEAMPDTVEVARVVRPHGLRGELLVEVLSDVRGRFRAGRELLLVPPPAVAEGAAPPAAVRPVTVVAFRRAAVGGLLRLQGVDDREAAAALRGARLEVPREASPRPRRGSYYWFELVG